MVFLDQERATLARLLPTLDAELATLPFELLESRDNPGIELFRRAGGSGLIVPLELGGLGACRTDAVRVQRAIAARTPSTALAATMHLVSTAAVVTAQPREPGAGEFLRAIAANRWLVASAHAEGRSGAAFNKPQHVGRPVPRGYRLTGTKKPCSLARSMDVITVLFSIAAESVAKADPAETPADEPVRYRRAHAVLGAASEGIRVEPFWRSPVLAGAQSEAVVFEDVFVPAEVVTIPDDETAFTLEEKDGFLWFLLLASASYLGCCSALVERCFARRRGTAEQRVQLAAELDSNMLALESVARLRDDGADIDRCFAQALAVRCATEATMARVAPAAAQCLGGIAFIESCDVAYLLSASQALAFHPPQHAFSMESLAANYEGRAVTFF